jgi:hypothetical protein
MASRSSVVNDPEIAAISVVYSALKDLDPDCQGRVIDYVSRKLNLVKPPQDFELAPNYEPRREEDTSDALVASDRREDASGDELEGISPVAIKWMRRNDLTSAQLSKIFSLGIDDIDLVAKKVDGNTKSKKMRSVLLLKGMAAYLGTGVARVTHEEVKEACLHYDAYDSANFARYLKGLSAEVSGSKGSGYTLTSRGITEATELIRDLVQDKK